MIALDYLEHHYLLHFKCMNLEHGCDYASKIARKFLSFNPGDNWHVFIIMDNDVPSKNVLYQQKRNEILAALQDTLGSETKIEEVILPTGTAFEYFLRLHFDKHDGKISDLDFIKRRLGEDIKSNDSKYANKLFKTRDVFKILLNNLETKKCEYRKLFSNPIENE